MDQERKIQEILKEIHKLPTNLRKRLAYLENAEYCEMNYYASMYLTYSQNFVGPQAYTNPYPKVNGFTSEFKRGFTFANSTLTCAKSGLYDISYNLYLTSSVALGLYVSFYIVHNNSNYVPMYGAYTIENEYDNIPKSYFIELEEEDTIYLGQLTSQAGTTTLSQATVTLKRIDDIS